MAVKPSKQIVENCKELNGIVALLAEDAQSPEDMMVMSGTLIAMAIRLYRKAEMEYEEIDSVLHHAVPEFRKIYDKTPRKRKK